METPWQAARTPDEKLTALAETFPSLKGALGVRPWNPDLLRAWGRDPKRSPVEAFTAQLVLDVETTREPTFAIRIRPPDGWDETHWAAHRVFIDDYLHAWHRAFDEANPEGYVLPWPWLTP